MYTERLSQQLAVVATIDPDAYTAAAYNSDSVDLRYHRRVMFIVQAGTLGASATLDFKVQYSPDASSWTDLSGKAITQLTKAGSDDDKQAIVEVAAEEVITASATARYVRGVLTVGVATSDAGVVALADVSRYKPASNYDLASVDEIVA